VGDDGKGGSGESGGSEGGGNEGGGSEGGVDEGSSSEGGGEARPTSARARAHTAQHVHIPGRCAAGFELVRTFPIEEVVGERSEPLARPTRHDGRASGHEEVVVLRRQ
jgi:hypothetical protein